MLASVSTRKFARFFVGELLYGANSVGAGYSVRTMYLIPGRVGFVVAAGFGGAWVGESVFGLAGAIIGFCAVAATVWIVLPSQPGRRRDAADLPADVSSSALVHGRRPEPPELSDPQDSRPWPDEDPAVEDKLTRHGLGR